MESSANDEAEAQQIPLMDQYSTNLAIPGTSQSTSNEMKKSTIQKDIIDANTTESTKNIDNPKTKNMVTHKRPIVTVSVTKDAECYNMNHKNRGKCIIFNHESFNSSFERRKGTLMDGKRLETTFGNLGFDVEIYSDLKHAEILNTIYEVSQFDHTDNDCLCVFVLTHGVQNDLLCSYDAFYEVDRLWEPFTADKCLTLAGKPKLFFIQACRGDKYDNGVLANPDPKLQKMQTETDSGNKSAYMIPIHADFLIAHSSVQGHVTWRNPTQGTWYIQSLCDIFDKYGTTMELMDLLTLTSRKIATECFSVYDGADFMNDQRQVPSVTTMLIRSVYFPSKSKSE